MSTGVKRCSLAFLMVLQSGLWCVQGEAQAGKTPKEFYPEGYVTGNAGQRLEIPEENTSEKGVGSVESPEISKDGFMKEGPEEIKPNTEAVKSDADKEKEESSFWDNAAGVEIRSLGLIVNAGDVLHGQTHMQELLGASQKYQIPISTVYAVGGMNAFNGKLPPAEWLMVKLAGGDFRVELAPPERYEVTLSPAWIVETPDGEVVLEAVTSLDKYLNREGKFVQAFLQDEVSVKAGGLPLGMQTGEKAAVDVQGKMQRAQDKLKALGSQPAQ